MRLERTILSLALLGTVIAVPAMAQQPAGQVSSYPECTTTPSKEDSEAAHNAYLFGKRKFDEAEYATAVNYFKDAYKTDCTKHEILIIISRAYELSGNKPEAINALEVYLKRVPNAPDADTQRKRVANLKSQMAATTTPQTAAPTTTTTAPTPTAPPAETAAPTATTAPTTQAPLQEKRSVAPWIVVGAGGVAVATGVVLIAVGAGQVGTANDEFKTAGCNVGTHTCPLSKVSQSQIDSMNNKLQGGYRTETIGGVVTGIGVAAVAGGLVWHFVFDKPKPKDTQVGLAVRPEVAPGYVGVGGTF